jgi:hypothetical protein
MRSSRGSFLVVLVALALLPAGAHAQGMASGARVRGVAPGARARGMASGERARPASMEETDRRIELAETVVSASEDAQARGELALARELQGRARAAAGAGRFVLAGQLTGQAGGHADRAIMLGRGTPTRERAGAELERTGEMLESSRARIEECGDERARSMLRAAVEMQRRAGNAAEAGRYLGALQLTTGARERCLRALRLCRLEESVQQVTERALIRTDEVLARARERLESGPSGGALPPRVRDALAQAAVLQDDASRQFRDGRWESSLRLTLNARRLARFVLGRGPRMP